MEILNERPVGMSFTKYRAHLLAQKKWLKRRKNGITIWHSNGVLSRPISGRPNDFPGFDIVPEGIATRHQLTKRCKELNVAVKLKEYPW